MIWNYLYKTFSVLSLWCQHRMNRFFEILLSRTKNFLRNFLGIASEIWHDSRVPFLARIFVVIAPLYWLNPLDLIPDLQPSGFIDDIVIASLLMIMALRLVPEAVFRDARKAVNPAVCGVMCLSVLGLASTPNLLSSKHMGVGRDIERYVRTVVVTQKASNKFTKVKVNSVRSMQFEKSHANICGLFELCNACNSGFYLHDLGALQNQIRANCKLTSIRSCLPILLATRGGQNQLYLPEYAALPFKRIYSIQMPPQINSGIFAAQPLLGEDSCLPKS